MATITIFSITQVPADPANGFPAYQSAVFAVKSGATAYEWSRGGIPAGTDVQAFLNAESDALFADAQANNAPIVSDWIIYVYNESSNGLPTYLATAKALKDALIAMPAAPTAANVATVIMAGLVALNADAARIAIFDKYRLGLGVTGTLNQANIAAMTVTMRSTLYLALDNFVNRGLGIGGLVTQDILQFVG